MFRPVYRSRAGQPAAALVALAALVASSSAQQRSIPLETPLQPAGSVSFRLQTERNWQNGAGRPSERITLLTIPDLGAVTLQQTSSNVALGWQWLGVPGAPGFRPLMPELPGPEEYFLQFTWDADAGGCDFYVNGIAMRDTTVPFEAWQFEKTPTEIVVRVGRSKSAT